MSRQIFSKRFAWDSGTNALGRLVEEKRSRGCRIYDLTQSNPTAVGLTYPQTAILESHTSRAALTYSPDPRGLEVARGAIAGYYGEMGCTIDPANLFLTANTSEAYSMLFKLLADPGDEVLIPCPGYPLLSFLAAFENLQATAYPLRYDDQEGWGADLEVLEALITRKTRAVVVVNPNNPTGSYLASQELAALDQICSRHQIAMIVDEVFFDYPADLEAAAVASALTQCRALTFVLNGFSKMLALPQVKLGWIALCGEPSLVQQACRGLETLLDFYLSVATPIQHGVAQLLSLRKEIQSELLSRLAENERYLRHEVNEAPGSRVLKRQGGWYAVLEFRDTLSDEIRVLQLLEKHATLVHPGYFYDFSQEGFVVISLLPQVDVFQEGVRRMLQCH